MWYTKFNDSASRVSRHFSYHCTATEQQHFILVKVAIVREFDWVWLEWGIELYIFLDNMGWNKLRRLTCHVIRDNLLGLTRANVGTYRTCSWRMNKVTESLQSVASGFVWLDFRIALPWMTGKANTFNLGEPWAIFPFAFIPAFTFSIPLMDPIVPVARPVVEK